MLPIRYLPGGATAFHYTNDLVSVHRQNVAELETDRKAEAGEVATRVQGAGRSGVLTEVTKTATTIHIPSPEENAPDTPPFSGGRRERASRAHSRNDARTDQHNTTIGRGVRVGAGIRREGNAMELCGHYRIHSSQKAGAKGLAGTLAEATLDQHMVEREQRCGRAPRARTVRVFVALDPLVQPNSAKAEPTERKANVFRSDR